MPQIRKNTLQDAKSYGIIVWLITAQKMQRYRSGHNGADSKSVREQSPASSNLAVSAKKADKPCVYRLFLFINIVGADLMKVRKYTENDISEMVRIWNIVVGDGVAFPQEEDLTNESGREFFASQTYCGVAEDDNGAVCGMYILHPNNIGRCGHICNASYAVDKNRRGEHIGEALVSDSLKQGKEHGFGVLQFNAVVAENIHARHLYERLGFKQLGTIPKGFRRIDGGYSDICPYYHEL